jgi:outer membrane protein assembly factor BamB
VISSPTVHDGIVYFGSVDGSVYALNAQTAREKWKFSTEKPIVASPTVHNDTLYIGTTNIYTVSIHTAEALEI